jgi:hypothetical protein
MEYLAGSLVTLVLIFLAKQYYEVSKPNKIKINLGFRQSNVFEAVRPTMQQILHSKVLKTQATEHFDKSRVRIVIADSVAYWIKDSSVYQAEIIDGAIQENSKKVVDMMALDDVKLKDMMFIIDKLTEGQTDDSRDSWNY